MQLFYEQSIPHPSRVTLFIDRDSCSSSSAPTIPLWAGYHLFPSSVLAPSSPVPAAQAQRTSFRSPRRDVEPTVRRFVSTSPAPHQHIDPTAQRLALIHSGSLLSHRFLDRATRNGKRGPMSRIGPYLCGAPTKPKFLGYLQIWRIGFAFDFAQVGKERKGLPPVISSPL